MCVRECVCVCVCECVCESECASPCDIRKEKSSEHNGSLCASQVLLFHLEEAGLRYVPQKNGFREVESTGPPGPR